MMTAQPIAPPNFVVVEPDPATTESAKTFEELVVEGQRLLDAGDKPRALAYFTMATNLYPYDEGAWMGRANSASEAQEIVECLEQVIALNPQNTRAREQLIFTRLRKLQDTARHKAGTRADASPSALTQLVSSKLMRVFLILFLVFSCGLGSLTLVAAVMISNNQAAGDDVSNSMDLSTPTPDLNQPPPTWTPTRTPTRTRTPTPTPVPSGKTKDALTIRSGPDPGFQRLGTLARDSVVTIVGKSSDELYLAIEYPSPGKIAWIIAGAVELQTSQFDDLPVIASAATLQTATRRPTTLPTAKPTNTPLPRTDFIVGRLLDSQANCNRPWQILGTVYASATKGDRVNGALVRVWAFDQVQGTITTGIGIGDLPGYWEWNFASGMEIIGKVAIVQHDGTLRSPLVNFHLTARCEGAGAVNQIVLDFVGSP
jgi:hypothetical protein